MYSNGTAPATFSGETTVSEILPHDHDAEQATIGCILIDPDTFYEIDLLVNPDNFYDKQLGQIYGAIQSLYTKQLPVDLITVTKVLESRYGDGMESTVIGLINYVPMAINATAYARIVEADSMKRKLIRAGRKIANDAVNGKKSVDALVEDAEQELFGVTQESSTKNVTPARVAAMRLYDSTMEKHANGGQFTGLKTGFVDLDRFLRLEPKELIILAARPGMGKSMFEGNIAAHVAKNGGRVARFNLEMGEESIMQRTIAQESAIQFENIKRGQFNETQLSQFSQAVGTVSEWRMFIDDSAGLMLSQLTAKCRRLQAEHGLDLITVDYLGLMSGGGSYAGNRVQEVSAISRGLKRLAKELHVPVLALSQLSRAVEQRGDKRPLLSDLRDSGSIEQDADIVLFLYREDYYEKEMSERPNVAELNVAKYRNGKTGVVDLYFNGALMRFSNLERSEINL